MASNSLQIDSLRRICDGNLVDLHRLLDEIDVENNFEHLHQAILTAISENHIFALNQLLAVDGLKQRAHANQNEALRTAIDHRGLAATKILLDLPNVREHARNLNETARQNLKALLQSEYSPDYAQDALSVRHNVLRFQETKANQSYFPGIESNENGYAILNNLTHTHI